jgi:hypothetical protein
MLGHYKLYDWLRNAKLLGKESSKDIIALAQSVCQGSIQGQWDRSEIPQKVRKLFEKLKIDSLT